MKRHIVNTTDQVLRAIGLRGDDLPSRREETTVQAGNDREEVRLATRREDAATLMGNPTSIQGAQNRVVGTRVFTARVTAGITPAQLAERIGMSLDSIEFIESGGWAPSPYRLLLIADALGVSAETFVDPVQLVEIRTNKLALTESQQALLNAEMDETRGLIARQRNLMQTPEERLRYRARDLKKRTHNGLVHPDDPTQTSILADLDVPVVAQGIADASQASQAAQAPAVAQPSARQDDTFGDLSPATVRDVDVTASAWEPVHHREQRDPKWKPQAATADPEVVCDRVLGWRLRQMRMAWEGKGIGDKDLTRVLGLAHQHTTQKWERGQRPGLLKLAILADRSGRSPLDAVLPVGEADLLPGESGVDLAGVNAIMSEIRFRMAEQISVLPTPDERWAAKNGRPSNRTGVVSREIVDRQVRKTRAWKLTTVESEAPAPSAQAPALVKRSDARGGIEREMTLKLVREHRDMRDRLERAEALVQQVEARLHYLEEQLGVESTP
jgi:transcriptional regulator with XRE-family HTH domain